MAREQSSVPLTKSVEFDINDLAVVTGALKLKEASLLRYLKAQPVGSQLYLAYDAEILALRKLLSKL